MAEQKKKKRRLSARLREEAFDIEGLDGEVREYVVREMEGTRRDEYMTTRKGNFAHDKDGKETGIRDYKDLIVNLLRFSLYGPDGALVSADDIRILPHSTQQALFDSALTLNGLAEKGGSQQSSEPGTTSPAPPAA